MFSSFIFVLFKIGFYIQFTWERPRVRSCKPDPANKKSEFQDKLLSSSLMMQPFAWHNFQSHPQSLILKNVEQSLEMSLKKSNQSKRNQEIRLKIWCSWTSDHQLRSSHNLINQIFLLLMKRNSENLIFFSSKNVPSQCWRNHRHSYEILSCGTWC